MRKRVKKPLALLMALLMMLTMFGSQVFAESTAPADAAAAVQGEEGTAGNDDDAGNAEIDSTAGTAAQDAGDGSQDADTKSAETAGTVEYVPEEQPNGVTVKAYAAEGVLPDGAVMKVTMLDAEGDTADQYNEAAAALEESDVDYAGFLAMDISFYDAEGNEIEPEDGAVNVQFEVDESLLPEEAEADTLAVQHLAETEDGIQVETVADAADVTDGTVAVAGKAVTAEFSVESFSYFTITWQEWQGGIIWGDYETVATQKIILIDSETGIELPGGHLNQFDTTERNQISIREYAPYVSNYTYQRAVVATNSSAAINTQNNIYRLRIEDGKIQYNSRESGSSNWRDLNSNIVYLLYSKDASGSTGGGGGNVDVDLPQPQISKQAVSNGDGTYDLSLSVTGSVGSQSSTVNVDVLMIVDESNSMGTRDGWGNLTDKNGNLIPQLEDAMRTLVNTLEENDQVDARYSIVSFGTTGKEELGWTSIEGDYSNIDYTKVGRAISGIEARGGDDGGTNYMAGFRTAKPLLDSANTDDRDAITVVVFLSDGEPTYYYTSHTGTERGGNGSNALGIDSVGWRLTMEEADDFVCNRFYSVAIGNAMSAYMNTNEKYGGLIDAVTSTSAPPEYIEADSDGSNLADKFEDIAGSVTNLYIKNVTITDDINTDNVERVINADGSPSALEITVSDGNPQTDDGQITTTEIQAGNINADYNNGILTLDFDDDYELKPGYTYTVTMKIQPTDTAEIKYAKSDQYPDTPTKGWDTGTHSNETGFYSNDKAELTFEYTENEVETGLQTIEYPKPVVQVQKGYLTLEKKLAAGLSTEAGTKFEFTISIPSEYEGTYNALYSSDTEGTGETVVFEKVGNNAIAKVQLAVGEKVTIILPDEINAEITENTEEYTPSWTGGSPNSDGDGVTVDVSKETRVEIVCTNEKIIYPPTGLIHTSAPFAVMIIIALGAVVIFITGRRIRR